MFKVVKVAGRSLYPEYKEGDFLILSKIPFFLNYIKKDNVIVFHHSIYGQMVKKVFDLDERNNKYYVIGTHPDSLDSRQLGWIDAHQIIGKVIYHVKSRES